MSALSVFFIFVAFCYICGTTTNAINKDDAAFLQAINLVNPQTISPKSLTPINQQQPQQQMQPLNLEHQQQTHKKHSVTLELRKRRKRSQHDFDTTRMYVAGKLPATHAYNLALFNIMQTLRKQLTNVELARLLSRLSRSAAADLHLLNEIYNKNNNNKENNNNYSTMYNNELKALNDDDNDNGNKGNNGNIAKGYDGTGDVAVGIGAVEGGAVGGGYIGSNSDMFANDIENLSEQPWQFMTRVSKKSSALYKPRLGKRTQQQQ